MVRLTVQDDHAFAERRLQDTGDCAAGTIGIVDILRDDLFGLVPYFVTLADPTIVLPDQRVPGLQRRAVEYKDRRCLDRTNSR